MLINAVKSYLKACPLLSGSSINVNYLGDKPVRYSIDNIPATPIVKRYTDGGTLRQFLFTLSSREAYDENELENMKVAQFFEEFAEWIEAQNNIGHLPELSEAKDRATRIEVTSSGYLMSSNEKTARFQVSLRLSFRRDL